MGGGPLPKKQLVLQKKLVPPETHSDIRGRWALVTENVEPPSDHPPTIISGSEAKKHLEDEVRRGIIPHPGVTNMYFLSMVSGEVFLYDSDILVRVLVGVKGLYYWPHEHPQDEEFRLIPYGIMLKAEADKHTTWRKMLRHVDMGLRVHYLSPNEENPVPPTLSSSSAGAILFTRLSNIFTAKISEPGNQMNTANYLRDLLNMKTKAFRNNMAAETDDQPATTFLDPVELKLDLTLEKWKDIPISHKLDILGQDPTYAKLGDAIKEI